MKYKIPVIWQNWGIVEVEADNLEKAIELAKEGGLPKGEYIEDSFEIDEYGIHLHNNLPEE